MTWGPKETQKTIYGILSNDSTLTDLLGGDGKIFSFVPDNTEFPYITLGSGADKWADRGSHTTEGWDARIQINVWYRGENKGTSVVQDIQARIDKLLHTVDIQIDGWNIIVLRRQTVAILTEPDNVTKHGVQIYKLFIGEVF